MRARCGHGRRSACSGPGTSRSRASTCSRRSTAWSRGSTRCALSRVAASNGAADFDRRYALSGVDPYAAIVDALGLGGRAIHVAIGKEHVMTKSIHGEPPRPGDEIVISGHSVGDAPRTAVILEVLGEPGHERYRVRWEDDHESIFFPAEDAVVRRPGRRGAARST